MEKSSYTLRAIEHLTWILQTWKNRSVILFPWDLVQSKRVFLWLYWSKAENHQLLKHDFVNHIVDRKILHWNFSVQYSPTPLSTEFPIKLCSEILSLKLYSWSQFYIFGGQHQCLFLFISYLLSSLPVSLILPPSHYSSTEKSWDAKIASQWGIETKDVLDGRSGISFQQWPDCLADQRGRLCFCK